MPWTKEEEEEQRLINAGGIHPYPWEAKEEPDVGWYVVDSNGDIVVLGPVKRTVAKYITESYNRHPIILLEDDVVY